MLLSPRIFKAYDIRGTVPSTLTPEVAHLLGRAFGALVREQGGEAVAVGRDGRLSSPALAEALISGLSAAGAQVIDIGQSTTPQLYFATHTLCPHGIQVTGSHNPKNDNGFKMVLHRQALYGDAVQDLRQRMEGLLASSGADVAPVPATPLQKADVLPAYRARIVQDIQLARRMKVVVDSGNGVAGASAPDLLRAIGCEVQELHSVVDGNFPNHHPDPSRPENLVDLVRALRDGDAEVGLAFDGDGDRVAVITRDGKTIHTDRQLMLLAPDVLTRHPGGAVVFDAKCSQGLAPVIEAAGGVPVMDRTGHSLIKAKMRELNAPLGGEVSGHLFFGDRWFGFDDGTYAACRLLEVLSRSADANAVLHALPDSYITPELHISCQEGEAHALVEQLLATLTLNADARLNTVDGLRVDWPDGFGLLRASNTTPVLVMRCEGRTPEALARIQALLMEWVRRIQPNAVLVEASH
ncbi:phosphomannomutase/phosphoglucomutase [Rhodoferax sp. TBRC 17660]|uniref:Phosphomannomutase/phosphoglucomutase n=1 Tax=Rhodoferax potami TaxID=3068338 RepID=A0ABU3KJP1_9BURK|nr:phosphomannomutase/phosphoglucomutase [Rhodoferax sp. TBRC 17660]MDT7517995.1 phosphomannomutase/phosphoglucomutase [Rhodoferax sp. TBRC 17660]